MKSISKKNIKIDYIKIGTDSIPVSMYKQENFIRHVAKRTINGRIMIEVKTPNGIEVAKRGDYLVLTECGNFFVFNNKDFINLFS